MDKYAFRMGLNSKHFECLVLSYLYSYKSNRTEISAISAFDLVSVPLQEVRTVHLDCAYFTPPLIAAAYSHLHFRRGASQTSLIAVIVLVHY